MMTDADDIERARARLAQRRATPTIFFVDVCGSLVSLSDGAHDRWDEVAPHVARIILQQSDALERDGRCSELVDGVYSIAISPLANSHGYAVLVENFRTRDAVRELMQRYTLTRREGEVAGLLISGASTQEIAEALCIATSTVVLHVKSILAKTGSRSRAAIVGRIVDR